MTSEALQRASEPSKRALATLKSGLAWDLMQKVKERPRYDLHLRPDGVIDLSGALNTLMDDWMKSYVERFPQTLSPRYGAIHGSQALLNTAAGFFNAFFHPHGSALTGDHLLAANGVTSLIDMMAWTLCDPGDGIVFFTPNFYMLDYDASVRSGVTTVPVSISTISDPFEAECLPELMRLVQSAVDEAKRTRRVNCRVLFLTNPANPQGRCYSLLTLRALAIWCRNNAMHLVADEIYALSTFGTESDKVGSTFSSVLSIPCDEATQQHIHCLYGVSEDFNMGGLRMGFLATKNSAVRTAASRVAWFTWLTSFSDTFITQFLERQHLVKDYISVYQTRLRQAYQIVSGALRKHAVPFAAANAGLFVFIDLGRWIDFFPRPKPESNVGSVSRELQLCEWLLDHGVFLNAGEFAGSDRPGHFRLVFTHNPEAAVIAVERIRSALDKLEEGVEFPKA
ncbi:hypothetical protein FOMG_16238 [Fusarium oxysporum f. sp. melonis 26406]|uniref:Aminotransferase class I/classII large domain-containing protein n=1 Tax=Fusarium oxysporum f. sp. melonis 26406 TaxID=1089452 RepID=X0A1K8_FUSOX|nr:hypothetical protein FOMG_16238 [Fusarium oxysporum f. sp. melonis 26406]